jgi:glycosyltransferase involved in cell wall biosynthesis
MTRIAAAPPLLAARHILFVVSSLGAGGAERVIAQLTSHLMRAGARISIVSFDRSSDPIYHDFPEGAAFHRLGARTTLPVLRTAVRVALLRRTIWRLAPDIVISFLTKINVITLAAATGMAVPVIVSERNNMLRQPMHFLWKGGVAAFFPRASAIVLQTAASAAMLPAKVRHKATVIGNPVDHLPWQPAGFAAKRITAVGRLTDQKGFDTLIDAFARVAPLCPDWQLDIWGEGPERTMLEARIEQRGLVGRIKLPGLSERPSQWIESASLFVLSSRYEGFPNVLGEAMAAGMPVIATNCAFGPAELVRDGENGLLTALEDPDALAEAMVRLIEDPALSARLAKSAARVSDIYSPRSIAGQWEALIREYLPPARRQAEVEAIAQRSKSVVGT